MLDRHIFIAHLLHFGFCMRQDRRDAVTHIGLLIAAGDLRQARNGIFTCRKRLRGVYTELFKHLSDQTVFLADGRAFEYTISYKNPQRYVLTVTAYR